MQIMVLTSAEESLMKFLWSLESFYLKDVMEQHPEPKPHQNTISTYLKILIEKNYLEAEKEGRIFKYRVKIKYEDYKKFVINNLIENHFNSSSIIFQEFLVQNKFISFPQERVTHKTQNNSINTTEVSSIKENPIAEFIEELTTKKIKKDKSGKDKSKKKDKKKNKK